MLAGFLFFCRRTVKYKGGILLTLTDSGQKVFAARYAMRDNEGNVNENFEQAVVRLAKAAASAEKKDLRSCWEQKFSCILGELLFIPSTPIWANIGKPDRPWQPSACFVLGVEDSLRSMYQTLADTAIVFKSGGGVGYNFSTIRPCGDIVSSTKGRASGVVSLIKLYNASSDMVMQGGVRRGASMGILNIDHPEIVNFIAAKTNCDLANFNLSVGVTDAFMAALAADAEFPLTFKGRTYQTVRAKELWARIADAAHRCGDPGIIFLDTIEKANPMPNSPVNATNPCGEISLGHGESCLLGSINLAHARNHNGTINHSVFVHTVNTAVRFLDNLIDIAEYPLPEIADATKATRKIGLGFTGLADALIMAGLPYDSKEGRAYAGEITALLRHVADDASTVLGIKKGCFPEWRDSVFSMPGIQRRNATCIAIAPTGSVTAMAGCEGYGIEPIFAVAYKKSTNVAGNFHVFSPLFLEHCSRHNIPESVLSEVAQRGTCQNVQGIPLEVSRLFKGAQEISAKDHLLMQAEVQKHVDNAVSKTINLPASTTTKDIRGFYKMAYEMNVKGITVFRDGSKKGTITIGKESEENKWENKGSEAPATSTTFKRGDVLPRPKSASGVTHRLDTGCGKLYLTVNFDQESDAIMETFITTGSEGGCLVYTNAASRLISLSLRGGIPVKEVIEQLQSVPACASYMRAKGKGKPLSDGSSCASAIAYELRKLNGSYNGNPNTVPLPENPTDSTDSITCDCGERLYMLEGCLVCKSCGYTKC